MVFINMAASRIQSSFKAHMFRANLHDALLKRLRLKMIVTDLV